MSQTTDKSGVFIIALSSLFFSLNTPIAPIFFGAGGNSVTLSFIRVFIGIFLALSVLVFFKHRLNFETKTIKASLLIGCCLMGQGLCYLGSVQYIPVGLAALVFYTWPIIVAIAAPLVGDKAVTAKGLMLFLLAFSGLALSLGASMETLDWRGVALAFAGGAITALMVLTTRKAVSNISPLSLTVTNNIFASLFLLIAMPFFGGWSLPFETSAVSSALAVTFVFFGALLTQNIGLKRVNSQIAAILYNLEPIFSIFAAFILLGEILVLQQYIGATIVFVALCLYNMQSRHSIKKSAVGI